MRESLFTWLESFGFTITPVIAAVLILGIILITALAIHILLHQGILRVMEIYAKQSQRWWHAAFFRHRLFTRLALTLQAVILLTQARIWLEADSPVLPAIETFIFLWVLLFSLLSLFSLLDTVEDLLLNSPQGKRLPVRGIFQSVKLAAFLLALIYAISLVIGKSPAILLSSLGAMTAVLLLVFKDPILGLVAGIQLSANNMLAVGDWLEMPKYGADGDVIDINLTTVKVRNWDKTITTIPTYALISDSFKNWRGMTEAGGRRIKRSINIDATSVKFLDENDLEKLRKAQLLSAYIENKIAEIKRYNQENNVDPSSPVNGRRMTNLGTFRAYVTAYLKANPNIHSGMIQMVRQLQPGPQGIPLEVYAFTSDTAWVVHEGVQADIFDHIFAVIPEFGLRVYQSPSGYDVREALKHVGAQTAAAVENAANSVTSGQLPSPE
ncbi:miniconductance mechanosensitive channel [Saccharophagus sp. K07]|jgi:miniconductance mechanosensitive channel|uniref:mechanosensitive ion channel family protein n=1 Tax=Saccharophagus sp. K07 TaxID=2283636 RepID=UPI0016526E49|nr:mechanosensitive ion channel domain-containing protein [Saccharophagus sp. K07]MBC6904287.1 miniconductance mechanosensitive channel [Saccharophagus sp. K07]